MFLSTLTLIFLMLFNSHTESATLSREHRHHCEKPVCKETSEQIISSIDENVNPCDDFYEFACGNWVKNHEIPEDKESMSNFVKAENLLNKNMRESTEKTWENLPTMDKPPAISVKFAVNLYKECMNESAIEELGIEPLKSKLVKLLGEWPVVKPIDNSENSAESLRKAFINFYMELGISPIFGVFVMTDANNTDQRAFMVNTPTLGLGFLEYQNMPMYQDQINAYKKYMEHAMAIFLKDESFDKEAMRKILDEIFDFESKLGNLFTPSEEKRQAEKWYNKMSIQQLEEMTGNEFQWLDMLNQMLSRANSTHQMSQEDNVVVTDLKYYRGIGEVLANTPTHVKYNYMGWLAIQTYARYLNKEMIAAKLEYSKATTGVTNEPERWYTCIKEVNKLLSFAMSRIYVEMVVKKDTKAKTTKMVNDFKDAFHEILKNVTWLDEETRDRAIDKLNAMEDNSVYPDWILDNAELDNYYNMHNGASVQQGHFFDSLVLADHLKTARDISMVDKPVNKSMEWPMPATIVNAAYDPTCNSVTMPAAIMNTPFFDPDRPIYVNYGGIGAVIGHEITHGFDDQGQEFDKNGNLRNWWTEKTQEHFLNKSKCFINQYGSIEVSEVNKTINGKNTVGENIADNGGVRTAFLAFQKVKNKSGVKLLPGLSKYTPEQIFFISYAHVWCNKIRPESLKKMVDYDVHSPAKYRVNVPLGNSKQFSKAFNCPADSPMNYQNRCAMW